MRCSTADAVATGEINCYYFIVRRRLFPRCADTTSQCYGGVAQRPLAGDDGINYGNALLVALPRDQICKDQLIKKAAKIVTFTPLRDHITSVFKQLHWLPVKCQIEYETIIDLFRCLSWNRKVPHLANLPETMSGTPTLI